MHVLMKKSTEPSSGEINKASEYYEKLGKDNEVYVRRYIYV